MDTGPFPGVKRPGRDVDHPPHLEPRLKKEWSYTSTPPLDLRGLFWGDLYLYLYPPEMTKQGLHRQKLWRTKIHTSGKIPPAPPPPDTENRAIYETITKKAASQTDHRQ